MVNELHHDECENGDKHYIKHYIVLLVVVLRSLRKEGYSQLEIDHLLKSIVLPNLVYGLSAYGAFEAQLSIGQCSAEIRWGGGGAVIRTKRQTVRRKVLVRDGREHRKQSFYMALATLDWSDVFSAVDINKAVEVLEEKILAVMDKRLRTPEN